MRKSSVQIAVLAGVVILVLFALWRGLTLQFAGFNVNPIRQDVVSIRDTAQLIRQDATQRAILLVPRSESGRSMFNACSEPPPDVAQNLAQSLNSSLEAIAKKGSDLEANVAAKISSDLKSAAELIFQRSQGIQLLRDTMFRLCEALQNGVIDKDDYRQLIQSLISTANFIIPFEQCTGMARASQGQIDSKILEQLVSGCLTSATDFSRLSRSERERPKPPSDQTPSKPPEALLKDPDRPPAKPVEIPPQIKQQPQEKQSRAHHGKKRGPCHT